MENFKEIIFVFLIAFVSVIIIGAIALLFIKCI
jgi:uncharacterized protein involved in outer membrane biogenesis